MPHLATALLGGAVLSLLPFTAATAAPLPVNPGTALRLTVTHGPYESAGGLTSSYRALQLTCDPAGGGHPKAVQACAELAKSDGVFEHGAQDVICMKEYSPVTVEASGRWRGRLVRFRQTYGNDCDMTAHTGSLFDF
jgi:hypothetical protein